MLVSVAGIGGVTTGWEQMDGVTTETGVVLGGERPQHGEWWMGVCGETQGSVSQSVSGFGERLTPTLRPLTHEIPGLVPGKAGF